MGVDVRTAETTQTLPETIARQGYAVLPGLLPEAEVAAVRDAVAGVYRAHGWLAEETEPGTLVPDGRRRDGCPGWWRFAEDIQRLEAFHRLAHHPALTGAARGIVGGRLLNHPRRHLTPVNPEFWVPPHQEYTYIQGTPDFYTAFVPLTDFPADGCELRVLDEPGERTVRAVRRLTTAGVEAEVPADGSWTTVPVRPGDVVFLHSLTTRMISENPTESLKLAALYRFQSRRLPVCKASIKPEHYPRLPDWPVITKGWSSRRWILPPMFARLTPYRMPSTIETWHELFEPDGTPRGD